MAGRGPQSFKKRQKEQQRKERREEKLAKRVARNQQAQRTPEGLPVDEASHPENVDASLDDRA